MPQLNVQLIQKDRNLLGRSMTAMANRIASAERQAARQAATTATTVTRASVRHIRPDNAMSRRGRKHGPNQLARSLEWKPTATGVEFDQVTADKDARYWIVQEIGTSQSAVLRRGGQALPKGRPAKGASYVKTVKSQKGREIKPTLAFGTGPRGVYTAFGAATGQQLYLRSKLKRSPLLPRGPKEGVYIREEIDGEHFVRTGGEAGFLEYRSSVLAAARRTFAGRGYRP